MKQIEYKYWLDNIDTIGLKKREILLGKFHTAERVYKATKLELSTVAGIKENEIDKIIGSRINDKIKREVEILNKKMISFITIEDEKYPKKLKHIYNPPYALYYKGRLPEEKEKILAVVGARNCSSYGMEVGKYIVDRLSKEGISIISGLARGIDCIAHKATVETNGRTYGILGSGVDICYPLENFPLYNKIQENGGVISEYTYGTKPLPYNFPMRNRIISGLSDGILVIEARKKSGTLITVDMGLDQGKEIYSIPGRSTDSLSEGCNNLLKQGAKLVNSPDDILEDFIFNYEKKDNKNKNYENSLESKEKIVYACLGFTPTHIDDIMLITQLKLSELFESLLTLELKNYITQPIKNYYVKKVN